MLKSFIVMAITVASVNSFIVETAQAQARDFNDRQNISRRAQDHRRGFREGVDCNRLETQLLSDLCRSRRCTEPMRAIEQGNGALAEDLLEYHESRNRRFAGPGIINGSDLYTYGPVQIELAKEVLECEGKSVAQFEADATRESEEWHVREDQRVRAEEERARAEAESRAPRSRRN